MEGAQRLTDTIPTHLNCEKVFKKYLTIRYTSAQDPILHIRDNETLKKFHSLNRLRFIDDFSFLRTTQRYLKDQQMDIPPDGPTRRVIKVQAGSNNYMY
jgi:hypothetical protein